MMNIYKRLRNRLKKMCWKKEHILWVIILLWVLLVWEGHRFLPGAKWLSEVIPVWIVILNLVLLFITVTLLANKRNPSLAGGAITIIGFSISLIFYRIGGNRFPFTSAIGVAVIILFNLSLKKWRRGQVKKGRQKDDRKIGTEGGDEGRS